MDMETIGAVRDHGGSLGPAMSRFPEAPGPWIDLSTGINPHPYPLPPLPASAWERLPEPAEEAALRAAAAAAYGAPEEACIATAPGTQILLPLVAGLARPGRARILGPTYAEHARAARLAGHETAETADIETLGAADLAVLVNPNNPDGRLLPADDIRALARTLERRGGLLVVDEAFMDAAEPPAPSLAGAVAAHPNLVVLRSFGKFFGLAGMRLGFAIAAPALAEGLRARLGPWAVSGPALRAGRRALADRAWQGAMRARLAREAAALDAVLTRGGLAPRGGTSLFRFVCDARAEAAFEACGRAGLHVRRFDALPGALRFGLPPDAAALDRLAEALAGFAAGRGAT